jgi:hypothetical protein
MKKRLIAVIVAIALILTALAVFLIIRSVRSNRPPELALIRPRMEALILASGEINEIFWGEGLPTHPRIYSDGFSYKVQYPYIDPETGADAVKELNFSGLKLELEKYGTVIAYRYYLQFRDPAKSDDSDVCWDFENKVALSETPSGYYRYAVRVSEARELETPVHVDSENGYYYYRLNDFDIDDIHVYKETDDKYYDYVREDCGYMTVDSIKQKAEQIYSKVYLDSVYESVFTGIAVDTSGALMTARYIEIEDSNGEMCLMKSNQQKGINVNRVFLLETMRMSEKRKSNATNVFVDIDTHLQGDPSSAMTVTVSFFLQDGLWYLNSPTY